MNHVVIVSADRLFADALSAIISHELLCEVTTLEQPDKLSQLDPAHVGVVVATDRIQAPATIPVISVSAGKPRKIHHLLQSITQKLASAATDATPLSDEVILLEKKRCLQHALTGQTVELTEKEQALLQFLVARGEAGRNEILKEIWGLAPDIDTHTLETHIYRLRQKWRELSDHDPIAATDKGYGFNDAG